MTTQAPLLSEIAELLEREHSAIALVDIGELESIELERTRLLAQLRPASADDRPRFAALEALRARNERAAQDAVDRLGGAIGRIDRGRVALAGYRTSVSSTVLSRALDKEV
ncbi:MAG TPA: hypothetical protein VGF46_08200 [Gaiellales bacterium]|jgi:hypothetical protein